ncbi:hypothetical protein M1P97_12295 [Parabacteroides sp. GYB001]|uniref:hypothetical protein n=1 Tax=Parabacteroides leei TaxID=2939491 RepID=UPI002016FB69|nr:hypothetical protein [Parabacteroides leei]MCL3852067.1 hypothetical protein [Parabacteroides leei]
MIVDKERKVIYLHNPKSGGTFLREIYIKKYGRTDAIKWWKPFLIAHGTDLGHISYHDLPRFVPEWENYRVIVMVRNPYNRFYSAVKELRRQFGTVSNRKKPQYVFDGEYKEWNLSKKFIYFLRRICPWTYTFHQWKLVRVSTDEFCKRIFRFKPVGRDYFLRNKRLPWLNPQSDFMGKKVEVLQYEYFPDWEILLDAFDLSEYSGQLKIAKDYDIPESEREMIRRLYPEDSLLFDLYKI